jgi:manganese/zinc/iron transport system permease protein
MHSILDYFTDPVLRAPTLGSMLMCLSSALVGVIVFLRKRSLLGEALSHAAYPGVVLSIVIASFFFPYSEEVIALCILAGAFVTSLIGLFTIDALERFFKTKSDAALCFVLSIFFGIGIVIASRVQMTHALWFKQIQVFLYGQAATMTDIHLITYGILALISIFLIFLLYHPLELINFDRAFARTIGLPVSFVDGLVFFLLSFAIVIGIRSVGVVLMSGMLIAPAVAARQCTHRLSILFLLAAIVGVASGFLGNYFSVEIPLMMTPTGERPSFSLPTGPMILLVAAAFSMIALTFAPKRGIFSRFWRILKFRDQCLIENVLKTMWKKGEGAQISLKEMMASLQVSFFRLYFILSRLRMQRWIEKIDSSYRLKAEGHLRATRIIRFHRLWEVYLVDYLGQGVEKVHRSAEEMEHIITPDLEKELTELLRDPKEDPHHQPIPAVERKT